MSSRASTRASPTRSRKYDRSPETERVAEVSRNGIGSPHSAPERTGETSTGVRCREMDAPRRSAHATAEAESEERTEPRSSRKERTRRSRGSRSVPGPVPAASEPLSPQGAPSESDRASSSPARSRADAFRPNGVPAEGPGSAKRASPSPTASKADSATRRNRSAIGRRASHPPPAFAAERFTSRASSRARPRETVTPKKTEAVSSTPCASSNTTASARGSTSPNRPSSPPRPGPSRSRSARSAKNRWWFTTTRSASAARRRAAARWHRSVSPHVDASHISLRAFTSPQTRASSGTPAHSETSPVRVVSANACIAEK